MRGVGEQAAPSPHAASTSPPPLACALQEALGLHADVAPKAAKRKAAEPVDTAAVEALGVEVGLKGGR